VSKAKEIILVGGGGHCRSIIDIIEEEKDLQIAGIIDVHGKVGSSVLGYPVIGSDDDIETLMKRFNSFHITIGHIRSNANRKKLFISIKQKQGNFPRIISAYARVSRHATVGDGTAILHNALVNANVTIGENCIVNTGAVLEHDVILGDHCHVAPGAVVNGECVIADDCFIGSNAVVVQGVKIGAGSLVAAGAVVIEEVPPRSMMAGNPAVKKKEL
jgi:sugar O-acyltransferase (sialic acid O-acetyltransferase NeuD family)